VSEVDVTSAWPGRPAFISHPHIAVRFARDRPTGRDQLSVVRATAGRGRHLPRARLKPTRRACPRELGRQLPLASGRRWLDMLPNHVQRPRTQPKPACRQRDHTDPTSAPDQARAPISRDSRERAADSVGDRTAVASPTPVEALSSGCLAGY
jgi:hypothetical protein